MALDEPKNEDEIFEEKGAKYVVDRDIYKEAKPIHIDFVDTPHGSGFRLTSNLSQAGSGGCGSCSC